MKNLVLISVVALGLAGCGYDEDNAKRVEVYKHRMVKADVLQICPSGTLVLEDDQGRFTYTRNVGFWDGYEMWGKVSDNATEVIC